MSTGDTDDAVFAESPTVIKVSGSGGIAALISKTKKSGQLRDISKKDHPNGSSLNRSQRTQSLTDESSQSTLGSKVSYRSVSVSPTVRQGKVTSVILTRGKSPLSTVKATTPDPSDQTSPISQSSGIASLEDTPTFNDTPTSQSEPPTMTDSPKPMPKPRHTRRGESLTAAGQEPQVEDLKNENQSLKQEISQLKEQHSELQMENKVLREHLQSSDEFDSPADSPKPKSKPESSKPIPIPRSAIGSVESSTPPRHHHIRHGSEQNLKPETPQSPVPKPRSGSRLSSSTPKEDEKVKAVKTLQALLPVKGSNPIVGGGGGSPQVGGASTTVGVGGENPKVGGGSPREVRGPDGLTRTERSLQQLQELLDDDDEAPPTTKESSPPAKPTRNEAPPTTKESSPPAKPTRNEAPLTTKESSPPAKPTRNVAPPTTKEPSPPAKPTSNARKVSLAKEEQTPKVDKNSAAVERSSNSKDKSTERSSSVTESTVSEQTSGTKPSPPKETSRTAKKETSVTPPREMTSAVKKETTRPSPPKESHRTAKRETSVTPPRETTSPAKKVSSATRSSPPRESNRTAKKETSVTPPGETTSTAKEQTSATRPSPPREAGRNTKETSVTSPSKTTTAAKLKINVTRPSPPREIAKETNVAVSGSAQESSDVPRPSATQGTPSSGSVTTTDTNTRDTQTPSSTAVLPTRPPPPKSIQKKTQIKSDASWIKRKDSIESYDSRSTISISQTMPDLSSTPSPDTARKNYPYRSHAIISTSTSTTPSSPYLPPAPSRTSQQTLSVPETTPPDSASSKEGNRSPEQPKQKKKRTFSFSRSSSNEKIPTKPGSKDKLQPEVKGQSPPKKPPRIRMLKTSSDSRPVSMMVENSQYGNDSAQSRDLTGSTSVGTIPRGTPPLDRKSKMGRVGSLYSKPEKKRFFSRSKNKTQQLIDAPPLQEEPDGESESSSDDEKGGTIKRLPKLRHVSVKPKSIDIDDGEPEYHQLFEYVFVVGLKEKGKELETVTTYTFPPAPEHVLKDEALRAIPQFCFPDIDQWKPTKSYNSESFSFVLTDMMGGRRFGYCRRLLPSGKGPRLPEVYCIVSPLGCFSLYEKILDNVEERRVVSSSAVFTFLKAIQANPFPRPGRSVEVRAFSAHGTGMETVVLTRPLDSRLEHIDFSLLFSTLSPRKIIQLFSSLLLERRVILCAHSLSLLSGCAHALLALMYPFEWQHVFIPVLPNNLIDFVCSPMPYIIGINPSLIKQLDSMEMEEALVIDLEKKKFVMKVGDETSILPTKLFQYLEHSLGSSVISSAYVKKMAGPTDRADEIVVNTFMTFFAYLYGDYKKHIKVTNSSTGEREFKREEFVKTFSSKSTKRFLKAFHLTQLFENFIEQRENPAKEATTAQSHFEQQLPILQPRCQEIEIFSSKSRFDRWKMAKGIKKSK